MDSIALKSPAKINFGLNVTSKRPDGYHNIETIFYPIQLHDEIIVKNSASFSFKCNIEALTPGEDNLIIKAVNLLKEYTSQDFQLDIVLKKNIPIGAGLGGGSSNAASILLALNELFQLKLSYEELFNIAIKIGSDVPFFLDPGPKFAEGKGDILRRINFKINYPLLIVNPGIHVSTPWAYSRIIPKNPKKNLTAIIETGFDDFSKLNGLIVNDFEDIVFKKFPETVRIKKELYRLGAYFSLMTGSGSTLFGIFPGLTKAREAEKKFSGKYFTFIHQEE
jgi:4-diphosphocytidyl-2-C-methyl-D-erythritol kinase